MKVTGKLVAITGGAGGIGSHLTRRIMENGGKVLVINRTSPEKGEFLAGDLSTLEGINAVAQVLAERQPDILVNLAGIQYFGLLENQTVEHILALHTVNLIAPTLLARAVLPAMKARRHGQIVNVGSVFGSIAFAHFVTYSSAKAGLRALSQGLRRELAGSGVQVTHISPRAVKTAMNDARIMHLAQKTRMKVDDPEHVAERILRAIESDAKEVVIGGAESFFTRVNALLPGVVDGALAKNDRIARDIVS